MIIPPIYQNRVTIMSQAGQNGDIVIDHVDCRAIGRIIITGTEGDDWLAHIIDDWYFQTGRFN